MKTNIFKQRGLELGITQQAVAIQLGMHIRQYQRFEYGEQSLSTCSMRTGLLKLIKQICIFNNTLYKVLCKKKKPAPLQHGRMPVNPFFFIQLL